MPKVTLVQLKELSVRVDKWTSRYDIGKDFYESLYLEHEKVHRFIEDNPTHFQSKEEQKEAFCLSAYICICLLSRINEINEQSG